MPLRKETIEPGIDVYDGECCVIYDPDRPPYWIPVTVEEAFKAAREFSAKETNEIAAAYNKQFLDAEWEAIPEEDRQKPAYFGGAVTRILNSRLRRTGQHLPENNEDNSEYFNRNLPKSAIQFMWFRAVQHKLNMKKELDQCREYMKKGSGSGCDLKRFELSFGMTDIRNLAGEVGR